MIDDAPRGLLNGTERWWFDLKNDMWFEIDGVNISVETIHDTLEEHTHSRRLKSGFKFIAADVPILYTIT